MATVASTICQLVLTTMFQFGLST